MHLQAMISTNFFSFDWQERTHLNHQRFAGIEKIIEPLSLSDFLKFYWKRKAVKITNNNNQRFKHFLDLEQLPNLLVDYPEDLIRSCDNSLPETGKRAKMLEQWHQGQTLFISRLELYMPVLAEFSQQIAKELKASTRMYAVCSHPNRQGAQIHCDRFDIFILQVEGNKKWRVQWEEDSTNPYLECVLTPGDVLYLPRGHWHCAIATNDQSLHVSLGISFKDFTEKLPQHTVQYQTKVKIKNKLKKIKTKLTKIKKLTSISLMANR